MKVRYIACIIFFCSLQGYAVQKEKVNSPKIAPYNLRWGMSYEEARNIPLYSLEVSDVSYSGRDPNLIATTVDPTELNISDYQDMTMYFDRTKGLKGIVLSASVDIPSDVNNSKNNDDGKQALSLYNKEAKELNQTYGTPTSKEEFISDKRKFYESLAECTKMQSDRYMKGLKSDNIPGCSKWQRDYKKDNLTILLTIEPRQITKQYIYNQD